MGITYDPKVEGFLEDVGLPIAGRSDSLTYADLADAVHELKVNRDAVHTELLGRKQNLVDRARRNAEYALDLLPQPRSWIHRKLRVLHIISGGDTGGAKTHIFTLAKQLQQYIDFELICFMDGEFYRDARAAGINIELIEQRRRYDLGVLRQLASRIAGSGCDLVHAHGARANFLSAALSPFIEQPILTTMHSDYKLDFTGNAYKNVVYTNLNALALRRLDYYVAVSEEFKQMLVRRGFAAERIFVVYNGIEFEGPMVRPDRRQFLDQQGLEFAPDVPIIANLGRLHPVKGHEVLLRAAAEVVRSRPDAQFLIAGDGPEEGRLKALAEELELGQNLHFLGFLRKADDLTAIADINTITSYSESFPYVLLEGARYQKATISSNVGGVSDLIRHGKNGLLFSPGDVQGLVTQLQQLLADAAQREAFGQALYHDAREKFSAAHLRDRHIEIYQQIVEQSRD